MLEVLQEEPSKDDSPNEEASSPTFGRSQSFRNINGTRAANMNVKSSVSRAYDHAAGYANRRYVLLLLPLLPDKHLASAMRLWSWSWSFRHGFAAPARLRVRTLWPYFTSSVDMNVTGKRYGVQR